MDSYCPKDLLEQVPLEDGGVSKADLSPILPHQGDKNWTSGGESSPKSLSTETKQSAGSQQEEEHLNTALQENDDLMKRLSFSLRKNSFMESKVEFLEKWNRQLANKNVFFTRSVSLFKRKIPKSHS